jgi:hypothetical protein
VLVHVLGAKSWAGRLVRLEEAGKHQCQRSERMVKLYRRGQEAWQTFARVGAGFAAVSGVQLTRTTDACSGGLHPDEKRKASQARAKSGRNVR